MLNERDPDDAPLSAALTAAAAIAASLLSLLLCERVFSDMTNGADWLVLIIVAPFAFSAFLLLGLIPLALLLKKLPGEHVGWAICLLLAGVLLKVNGVPGLFGLGVVLFVAVSVYIGTARDIAHKAGLKALTDDGAPQRGASARNSLKKVVVNRDALKAYDMPLWERLEYDKVSLLSGYEGVREGYAFRVLDLQHAEFGFRSDHGKYVKTTFFIIAIPDAIKGRTVTWQPNGWDVSVDKDFLYMARTRKRIGAQAWPDMLQKAVKAVASLRTQAQMREKPGARRNTRTYRPIGIGVVLSTLSSWLAFAFGVVVLAYSVAIMSGVVDYRNDCQSGKAVANCSDARQPHTLKVALHVGAKMAIPGIFLIAGAYYLREQAQRRRRNNANVQADV